MAAKKKKTTSQKDKAARDRAAAVKKTPAAKTRGTLNVNARRLYLDVDNAEDYRRR